MQHLRRCAAFAAALIALSVAPLTAAAQSGPDLLVVGGTPAGVAAAVAAARRGESVEVVAQRPRLGGILTDAGMDQWDLNVTADGMPVEGGIFGEIYARLGDAFTPAAAAAAFGDFVAAEPGIRVVTDAQPIAVQTSAVRGGTVPSMRVDAVDFRLNGGRTLHVAAPAVIDATDDGDVAALAGARYDVGRQDTGIDERMQPVTLLFTLRGVDWRTVEDDYDAARDGYGGTSDRRAWGYALPLRAYRTGDPSLLVRDLNLGRESDGDVTVNAIDVLGIDGRKPADLVRARMLTEREAPRLAAWLRTHLAGFAAARVSGYADAVYVRETRHVAGIATLSTADVWHGVIPRDSIGLSSYPIDLHPVTANDEPAFAPTRHVYGIPFGALVPRGYLNLLVASPSISASHLASGSARVIPTTMEEGEAAGIAATLERTRDADFPALDADPLALAALDAGLRHEGALLSLPRVGSIVAAR